MLRKKIIFFIVILMLVFGVVLVNNSQNIFADDLDKELQNVEKEIDKTKNKIDDLSKKVDEIKNQVANLSGSLNEILSTIKTIENEIADLEAQLKKVNIELNSDTANLTKKTIVRDVTLRSFYKKSPTNLMVSLIQSNAFLSDDNTSQYLKKYIDDSVQTISDINSEITINEKNKGRLLEIVDEIEAERVKLVAIKKDTEEKLAKQQEDLAAKNRDLSDLNKKLNGLLEKQQQILSAKNGDFSASLGEGVQTDDPNSAPDYNPGFSPAFAAFSYGAYTHYKGMSQYGAKGRAEEGKSYSDIIKFYYKEDVSKKDDFPSNICVEGYGDMDFQRYLYGLGEMPSTWPGDALKAQAVAARSYAYRYVKAGKCICTSQSCQVFIKSKSDNPPDAWKSAVDDTKNKIIGGSTDASGYGWYSSTSGGYIDNVGWDAKGSWPNDAYENRAKSPWFYKGWYTESYSKSSAKCGRDHPWLTEEEMADILNAYILLRAEKDTDRITPLTTSCWGGNPYSISELRSKADGVDTGYSKVKSVSVSYGNNGQTSQVTFETDKGTLKADGQLFKSAFNLRAPGYVAIKSRLYDIRRK